MKFKAITDKIIHITMSDKKALAKLFIRFQEHYESPYAEIRGKIFTVNDLRRLGDKETPGVFTYFGGNTIDARWSGYNFPSHVLLPFFSGNFDPLTAEEQDLVESLRFKEHPYYVIGTKEKESDEEEALSHEISHALYYINPEYKKEVDEAMAKYDFPEISQMLRDWGYCEEVLLDEIHAYLGSDYEWFYSKKIEDIKKYNIPKYPELNKKLLEIKGRYFT